MSNKEQIVVAVHIGRNIESFCQQAIQVVKKLDAVVTLAHAIEYIPYYPYFPYDEKKVEEELNHEINTKLKELTKMFTDNGIEVAGTVVKKDKAFKVICEAADEVNASKIIVGVGPHYLLENMIGSTADKVVRLAKQEVFLINPYKNLSGMDDILCGYDFTESSDRALNAAAKLAKRFSGTLNILHVVPDTGLSFETLIPGKENEKKMKESVLSKIQEKVKSLDLDKVKVNIEVVDGNPVVEISKFVEDKGIELLVIGTHSQNTFERLFLGSITEKIVRKALCNIITTKKD